MFLERQIASQLTRFKKSCLLLGPRQTGKSTLLRHLSPDLEINLADEEVFLRILREPGVIKQMVHGKKHVLIDEVQRVPSLLNTLQVILDSEKSAPLFFLSGSSARKLKRGSANLLPGRILVFSMGPLSLTELGAQFDLKRALSVGLLPGPYFEEQSDLAEKTLRSYAATYLKEEIQAEALTRNLAGFSRFFDIVLSRNSEIIDFEKFSSLASIERTSARRYFEILQDTLILSSVEAFTKSTRRRLIQHPKFYLFDVGVLNGGLGNFTISEDRCGMLFETLVLQLIQSELKARDLDFRISMYRTDAGAEVDFILELKREIFGIEVKWAKTLGKKETRGLRSFQEFLGKKRAHSLIAYPGSSRLRLDDDSEAVPVDRLADAILSRV